MLTVLQLRVTAVEYPNVFKNFAVRHFPVRSFDEAKLVDAGKAGETGNQPDVRTFRRLNRTNSAVVSRVNVADFKSGALARQAAWSQRRETAFVRNFRKRIGLIHELRELARAKKLTHCGSHGLGVDEVAWHRGLHFLVDRHLLLDRTFHAFKADAKLVFEEFADRTYAAVAEMVDIIRLILGRVLTHLQHVSNHFVKIFG